MQGDAERATEASSPVVAPDVRSVVSASMQWGNVGVFSSAAGVVGSVIMEEDAHPLPLCR